MNFRRITKASRDTFETARGSRRPDWIACAILTLLWLIPLSVIGVSGEFPLNDDFAYAWSTERLLETGSFERHPWTWIPVVSNVLVGSFFSLILGFSDETLRASGVFMGWLGLIGCYVLCRQMGVAHRWSFLAALVTGLNPVYLNLSYSFMTDVPFTAFTVWSLVFLVRGLASPSWGTIIAGLVLAAVSILSRQPGLAILVALVLTVVMSRRWSHRTLILWAAGFAVGTALVYGLPYIYQAGSGRHLYTITDFLDRDLFNPYALYNATMNSITSLVYLGLFATPIVILYLKLGQGQARLALISVGFSLIVLLFLLSRDLRMPLGINIIYDLGVGPVTLSGGGVLPRAGSWFWQSALVVGLMGGFYALGLILLEFWQKRISILNRPAWLFLFLFVAVYLGVMVFSGSFFDRYFLPILPPLMVLLLAPRDPAPRRPLVAVSLGFLALMATFGLLGTRDYLEHHRHRWGLLDELVAQGIPTRQIDGGFEFNAKFNYPDRTTVGDDEYIVSYEDSLPGYTVIATSEYGRLLPPGIERVSVHRRSE